jgi:hypothetical protein
MHSYGLKVSGLWLLVFAMIRGTNPRIAEWSLKRRCILNVDVVWTALVFAFESEARLPMADPRS